MQCRLSGVHLTMESEYVVEMRVHNHIRLTSLIRRVGLGQKDMENDHLSCGQLQLSGKGN